MTLRNARWTLAGLLAVSAIVVPGFAGTAQAADGQGQFRSAARSNLCLDVAGGNRANGTAVQLYGCNDSGAQAWAVVGEQVRNTGTGKCLDVNANASANGTRIQIWDCFTTAAQRWDVSGGRLRHQGSGKCLDVPRTNLVAGQAVQLHECNDTNAQRFDFAGDEARFLQLLNDLRARNGRAPVRIDPAMTRSAYCNAEAMSREQGSGHNCPLGAGVYGEIAFYGPTSVGEAFDGWVRSQGHFALMIDERHRTVGLSRVGDRSWNANFGV